MRYGAAVRLYKKDKFFGPGVAQLLTLVEQKGSLRMAAGKMGMAYSKAWRLIKTAEEEAGFAFISSKVGGKNGGGAVLTPDGKAFLQKYLDFAAEVQAGAQVAFQKYFG